MFQPLGFLTARGLEACLIFLYNNPTTNFALSCSDDRLISLWLSGGVCVGRSSLSDFGFSRFADNSALHSGTSSYT
jgi:hypothetical protein